MSQVIHASEGSRLRGTGSPFQIALLMAAAIGLDLAVQRVTHDVAPGLFLLPAVIAVTLWGGLSAGIAAAAVVVAFAAVDLCEAGPLLRPPYDRAVRLAVLCLSVPAVAVAMSVVRQRVQARNAGCVRAERDRADAGSRAFVAEREALIRQRDMLAVTDRQTQRRLADLIAAVPGVVWEAVVDGPNLRVAFISRFIEPLLGYAADRWTGSTDLWTVAVHPVDRDRVRRWLDAACDAGSVGTDGADPIEFRWVGQDGREVWVETRLSAVPALSPGGRCVALRGVTSDITARKHLERAVAERAADLAVTATKLRERNEELDQFAYVTSHDLKAPLRGIGNLSTWIEEDLGPDRVPPESHDQFELLRGRVRRMERLIDGLLEYSRVGRTAVSVEWVDVGQLVAEVIDWVGPAPAVRVTVAPGMPAFNADRLRLGQVLANLIGNAVKHGGSGVRVCCDPATGGEGFEFAVTDDGPGIDARYHDRIFGVFQTLQPRDKVEGTGIGLALVRKVVAGKGGTVSVESAVGRGATFRFTWPRVDPAAAPPARRRAALQEVPS